MERRQSGRISVDIPLTFSDGIIKVQGMSSDFSHEGLFIITKKPFKAGTDISMLLEVSANDKIYTLGKVIRVIQSGADNIKDGMGIKITRMTAAYQKFIRDLAYDKLAVDDSE
ncbi:MAG: PilZ domain-containing protein [Nitrospira sp.]|nr:PilZ domain-containing protein [bacterium]MBL7048654.1 PilZ domain-containing protein [Nitrospira sp.]